MFCRLGIRSYRRFPIMIWLPRPQTELENPRTFERAGKDLQPTARFTVPIADECEMRKLSKPYLCSSILEGLEIVARTMHDDKEAMSAPTSLGLLERSCQSQSSHRRVVVGAPEANATCVSRDRNASSPLHLPLAVSPPVDSLSDGGAKVSNNEVNGTRARFLFFPRTVSARFLVPPSFSLSLFFVFLSQ